MDTFYSLFYKKTFSSDIVAFPGTFHDRPDAYDQPYDYSFHTGLRKYEFWNSLSGTEPQMTGKHEKLFTRTHTIRANNGIVSTLKQRGSCFHSKWTLVFNSEEFEWKGDWKSKHFVLTNQSGHPVAKFDRASRRMSKVGDLIIYGQHDDTVKALIVFTCCIMYQTVLSSERSSAAAASSSSAAAAVSV
ncbi:hypothetical protein LPJ79_005380 [Coemansia sp. RSA 1821]|nr:hypothetical protein LPJ68_005220 [Coemansia sp. RSA 1086]KAJ1747248.1 hypothetical protein LPJ79_005380 [Coemansia sp. RSA 1821]